MAKDEAMLIKNWDSAGRDFREACTANSNSPFAAITAMHEVPATFALHSAFEINAPTGAPERESIEVRLLAIYDDQQAIATAAGCNAGSGTNTGDGDRTTKNSNL